MKKRIIVRISILVIFTTIIAIPLIIDFRKESRIESGYKDEQNSANQYAEKVTMIQLIATPDRYDGELVRVIGVGNLEFEGNCLSLSKEDLKYSTGNSIWIELGERAIPYEEAKKYNGEYVIVEGIFDKDNRGHMGMYCGAITNINRYQLWDVNITSCCNIIHESDGTYSYEIQDYDGNVLFSGDSLLRQPQIEQIDTDVIGLSVQTGTGLSTNWAVYCDVENSKVSETFYYVLAAQDDYVIYANYEDGKHSIIVQDIFERSAYYKTYDLQNISPVAADFTTDCKINGKGSVTVTYLTGEDFSETDLTINFP